MATNLPSCFSIQFLEQALKYLVNFTLLKYVKSQRNYGFLITKELIFGFQILDLKDHFSASLTALGLHLLRSNDGSYNCSVLVLSSIFPTKYFENFFLLFPRIRKSYESQTKYIT